MPGVVAPAVAARIELILIDGVGAEKMEDVLIGAICFLLRRLTERTLLRILTPSRLPINLKLGEIKWINFGEDEREVALCGATSRLFVDGRVNLLNQFQYRLLGLVCLLKSSHAGGLQDVVLGHICDRFADVSILNAVGRALQVRDLVVMTLLAALDG